MKRQLAIGIASLALGLGGSCLEAGAQKAVVVHAGQLFDGKSDRLSSNQVIVIQGDRITEVGPAGSVKILLPTRRTSTSARARCCRA